MVFGEEVARMALAEKGRVEGLAEKAGDACLGACAAWLENAAGALGEVAGKAGYREGSPVRWTFESLARASELLLEAAERGPAEVSRGAWASAGRVREIYLAHASAFEPPFACAHDWGDYSRAFGDASDARHVLLWDLRALGEEDVLFVVEGPLARASSVFLESCGGAHGLEGLRGGTRAWADEAVRAADLGAGASLELAGMLAHGRRWELADRMGAAWEELGRLAREDAATMKRRWGGA